MYTANIELRNHFNQEKLNTDCFTENGTNKLQIIKTERKISRKIG